MEVYKAINAVASAMSLTGIAKNQQNTHQRYNFRGIDSVYCTLAPILAKNGLLMLPRVMSRTETTRTTSKGGQMIYAVVHVEYDLVSVEDGSKHTIATTGEASDTADKATNKAMSAAYKYAAIQAFCIPTEGTDDADAHHNELGNQQSDSLQQARNEFKPRAEAAIAAHADMIAKDPQVAEYVNACCADGNYEDLVNWFNQGAK